jgi:hypothetical protein
MNAYLPSKCLQVALHQQHPKRLEKLLQLLEDTGLKPNLGVSLSQLSQPGLLLLPSRQFKHTFDPGELDTIKDFINSGNSLFHLSNHPPLPKEDSRVGYCFGYRFENRWVKRSGTSCDLDIYPTPEGHLVFGPISDGLHFTVCNSCAISPHHSLFCVIADFSRSGLSTGNPQAPFGIARPRTARGGAIVALADSGLLGDPVPSNPGPGLGEGDNRELVRRITRWLVDQTTQPARAADELSSSRSIATQTTELT